MIEELYIRGVQIQYYFVCHRQLWFFSNEISCEHTSELVELGRLLHQFTYQRERKEVQLDAIKLDWLDIRNNIVHEVKKSDKAEESHTWQLKYYLYYLRFHKFGNYTGELNYPKLKKKVEVKLEDSDIDKLKAVIIDIRKIVSNPKPPPPINKSICKNCSYFELCYI